MVYDSCQIFSQILHEMQPELFKERWQPSRHEKISGLLQLVTSP